MDGRFLKYFAQTRSTLDVAVFTITCNEIAAAVEDCHKRGVKVRIITDDEQVSAKEKSCPLFVYSPKSISSAAQRMKTPGTFPSIHQFETPVICTFFRCVLRGVILTPCAALASKFDMMQIPSTTCTTSLRYRQSQCAGTACSFAT